MKKLLICCSIIISGLLLLVISYCLKELKDSDYYLVQHEKDNESDFYITYIKFDDWFIPVSYFFKGQQLLSGDVGAYSQIKDTVLKEVPEAEELSHYEGEYSTIASNGSWCFFPDHINYVEYTLETQPLHTNWVKFFQKRLNRLNYDGPIIIIESYAFDYNGKEISIVTASNLVFESEDAEYQCIQPQNNNPIIYTISALFFEDEDIGPIEIYNRTMEIPKERDESEHIGISYLALDDDYTKYTWLFSAVQYGQENNNSIFPIYCDYNGELNVRDFKYIPCYCICDIDGDKKPEVVQCIKATSSSMSFCVVYNIAPFEKTLSIVLN